MNDRSRTERRLLATIRHAKNTDTSASLSDREPAADPTGTPAVSPDVSPAASPDPSATKRPAVPSARRRGPQVAPAARSEKPRHEARMDGYQSLGRVWPD
jgi:hypothetical protein